MQLTLWTAYKKVMQQKVELALEISVRPELGINDMMSPNDVGQSDSAQYLELTQ